MTARHEAGITAVERRLKEDSKRTNRSMSSVLDMHFDGTLRPPDADCSVKVDSAEAYD